MPFDGLIGDALGSQEVLCVVEQCTAEFGGEMPGEVGYLVVGFDVVLGDRRGA